MHDFTYDPQKVIKTQDWLDPVEIGTLLENVSHIILAQPNIDEKVPTLGHFTLFLNTQDQLPDQVANAVLDKFCEDHTLIDVQNIHMGLHDIAFAKTNFDQPMPIFLDPKANASLEGAGKIKHFIIDFDANFESGFEEISQGQSGWSYVHAE